MEKTYICIDLKSFYASCECAARGRDPLTTNLVVADVSRTEKTICLAVSPSLKAYGIPGRARLFEVIQAVDKINMERKRKLYDHRLKGESDDALALKKNPNLALSYIAATPHMSKYIKISSQIYSIYLRYIAPEDIHVYSIDEVFMDVTGYLKSYGITAHELALRMIHDVLRETGITATAGIGTNMYLAKVAMDIEAKHIPADKDGVRIAELNEMTYREKLWSHKPISDFWRVGRGISAKLESYGLYTMGDVARCSLGDSSTPYNEEMLYKLFGVNAELLIDHAWGYEPVTMKDIKAYKPSYNSYGTGQVLHCATPYDTARLIVNEMADQYSLDLVSKHKVISSIGLYIGYDTENIKDEKEYEGEVKEDWYGRKVPKAAHGSIDLGLFTSSTRIIVKKTDELFNSIVNKDLLIRRINIAASIIDEDKIPKTSSYEQLDLFTDYEKRKEEERNMEASLEKERNAQEAILKIKEKYGKNSCVKGMNLEEGATQMERNNQIGGHKA